MSARKAVFGYKGLYTTHFLVPKEQRQKSLKSRFNYNYIPITNSVKSDIPSKISLMSTQTKSKGKYKKFSNLKSKDKENNPNAANRRRWIEKDNINKEHF